MRVPGFFAPLGTAMPDGVDVLKNLYREDTGDPERPYRFVRRPGKRVFVSGLHGDVRGGVELDGQCDVIAGERWYSIAADGTATEIGAVAPDTRPSMMISNGTAGNQVAGVSGGKLYVRDVLAGTFGEVVDADLPGDILGVVHTDLYAVAWFRNSRAFRISSLVDFTAWAGGDVAERSQYVDNILAIIADQKELQILGSQTQEAWWDSGAAAFPFEPVPKALSTQGAAATHGAVLVGDTPYWVGQSREGFGPVFRTQGYTPQRISTHWVERKIQALAVRSDAYAYSYEEMGHRFYVLTFPNADVTLAFDEAVDPVVAWSERTYRNPYTNFEEADLGRCHLSAFGKHLVGSRRGGTIYESSLSIYDDAGDPIRAVRRFQGPQNEAKPVFIGEARLDAQVGVGLTNGQGADPQIMLRKSRDGGRTFGPEQWRSLGATGRYGTRVRWQNQGEALKPAFELAFTDPTVLGLNEFHVGAEGAAH
jgi:hypothetical protein